MQSKSAHTRTTGYSTHSEVSIQRRLFHVLRGPSPQRIVSNTTQDIYISYIRVFCQVYFDISCVILPHISRNTEWCIYPNG